MKKIFTLLAVFLMTMLSVNAQYLLQEGFENDIDNWTMVSMDSTNNPFFGIFNSSDNAYEGDNCFRFSSYLSAMDYNQYLITPELTLNAGITYMLQFYYRGYRASDKFKVMYSTTDNDISSFTPLYDFETVPTSWTQASFALPSGTKYVAINYYGDFAYYLYVDNFNIGQITAPTVTINGPASVQTGASAQFIAESQLAETFAWTVDGTAVPTTTDTLSYTFSTAGTHTISVTVGNTAGSTTATHTVEVYSCDDVQTLPFFEGFENDLSACWQNIDNDGDGYYWTPSSQFAAHTGNGMIYSASYLNSVGALSPDNWLVTPAVNLSSNATLSFWVCAQDDRWGYEHYGVYISTTGSDSADFTLLFEETLNADSGAKTPSPWKQKTISLYDYTGQTVRIAFRHFNCSDMFYLNIDDIEISNVPSITVAPNTLSINTIVGGQSTATATVNGLNLTDGITATTTAPFAVSSDGITFNSTTTLPLTGGTLYVQYSATAEGSETGTVTLSSTGATDETITLIGNALEAATLPYSADFEDSYEKTHWMIVGEGPNNWVIGTAANYTEDGEYALYVSNDSGTTNAYTNSTASVSWAYRDIVFDQFNEYHLAFDFRGYGENNYDYLKVYLGYPAEVSASSFSAPEGATLLGTFSGISDWTHFTTTLPSSFSGLQRLYLLWRNDGNVGTNPPAAIDNLTIVGSNCVAPNVYLSDFTPESLTLNWVAGNTESSWEVEYCTDTANWISAGIVTSSPYTIDNLDTLTTYTIRIRSICGDGEFSDWETIQATTSLCGASERCAYTFNLTDSYGDGWNGCTLDVQQNGVTVTTLGLSSGSSATETVNLCDNIPTSLVWHMGSYAYEAGFSIVSPYGEVIYIISNMANYSTYTFTSRCDAPDCPSPVKNSVVASDIDGHNATISFTDNDPSHNSWTVYYRAASASQEAPWITVVSYDTTVTLTNLTAETTYDVYVITNCVAPDDIPDATYTVQFTTSETCLAPQDVTIPNIGATSATVTWSSDADSFTIEYGETGFNLGEGIVGTSTDTYYTISNLAPATSYTVYITANCGVEGTSSPATITFTTTLAPVGLPYTTDFSANADQNWMLNNGTCTNHWVIGTLPENSSNALFITSNDTTPGYNITNPSVVSASKFFTVGDAAQFRISFDVLVGGESSFDYLKLFFAPATEQYPASTTNPTASDYGYNSYSAYAYDFSDYLYASISTSNIAYKFNLTDSNVVHIDAIMPNPNETPNANSTAQVVFAWKNDNSVGTQPGAIISNVSVSLVSCPTPEDVHTVSATTSSIELGWTETGSATTWEIAYGAPGFDPDDATTVLTANTNPFEINGLGTSMTYDFYVRALCGGSDVSSWSNVLTASTTMEPVGLPYTADFSDPNDAWVLKNGGCVNYWTMGMVDEEDALFVTTDSTSPGYNITSTSVVSAQKLFTVGTSPTVTISYDVQVGGESHYDYLKMFLAPASVEFPASSTAPASSDYAHSDYSDYAYDFLSHNYSTNISYPYILNLLDSAIHVQATMANPNANPDANSTALLVFAWKNDGTVGTQPAAIIKNLTVTSAYTATDVATICASELPYEWNGVIFTEGGTQTATLQAENGSDSIVTMILTVNDVYAVTETRYVCPNELPYEWNGVTFTAAGSQIVTLTAANGCDSVVTMMLYINPTYTVTDARTICQSELPYEWNGVTFTAAGAQIATLQSTNGCDSVVVMALTVNETYAVNETVALCPSELPYVWNGLTFTESGTQTLTLQTENGCDSVLTMTVTVNSGYAVTETTFICPNELPYEWNGVTFTAAGIQNVTLTAADGCDSVVTMVLNIYPTFMVTDSRTICPGELPYEWNGVTFTAAGVQATSLQTVNGCDSVVVMTLTVLDAITSEFTIETSDSCYQWNGQTYCSSGDYTQTFTAANGCDSVVTLHLTTSVGVVNHELGTSLYLAPNPTKNISRIMGLSESLKCVEIMDMRGRLVIKSYDHEIDVSTLPAGVYVVKVFTESGITNLKLVKQ